MRLTRGPPAQYLAEHWYMTEELKDECGGDEADVIMSSGLLIGIASLQELSRHIVTWRSLVYNLVSDPIGLSSSPSTPCVHPNNDLSSLEKSASVAKHSPQFVRFQSYISPKRNPRLEKSRLRIEPTRLDFEVPGNLRGT